jgi:hypothetical protein
MFTIETEFEYTKVTTMDNDGEREDLIVRFCDEGIALSQWNEQSQQHQTLWITERMLQELIIAMDYPDGTYQTE